jgi:hypothetical protein
MWGSIVFVVWSVLLPGKGKIAQKVKKGIFFEKQHTELSY